MISNKALSVDKDVGLVPGFLNKIGKLMSAYKHVDRGLSS